MRVWIVVLLASLCACADEPMPFEQFVEDLEEVACAVEVTCGGYPDVATCRATQFIDRADPTILAATQRGTIVFDAEAAAACLDALADTPCRTVVETPDACREVLLGQVAPEGECVHDFECAAGDGIARCEQDCESACCVGRCDVEAFAEEGESCVDADGGALPCMAGTRCVDQADGGRICVARPVVGERCTGVFECAEGFCRFAEGDTEGTCVLPAEHGDACDPMATAFACAELQDQCTADGTCERAPQIGERCGLDNSCARDAYCDADEICRERLREGEPCDRPFACYGRLRCDRDTEVCTLPDAEEACLP